jgi:hypothetical protein
VPHSLRRPRRSYRPRECLIGRASDFYNEALGPANFNAIVLIQVTDLLESRN